MEIHLVLTSEQNELSPVMEAVERFISDGTFSCANKDLHSSFSGRAKQISVYNGKLLCRSKVGSKVVASIDKISKISELPQQVIEQQNILTAKD